MYRSIFAGLVLLASVTTASAFGPGPWGSPGMVSQGNSFNISIRRGQDQDGYYAQIALNGVKPEQLNIVPQGRSLLLKVQQQSKTQRNTPNGQSSFSMGQRSMSQQLSFPPDADLSNLRMKNVENGLMIAVPRMRR